MGLKRALKSCFGQLHPDISTDPGCQEFFDSQRMVKTDQSSLQPFVELASHGRLLDHKNTGHLEWAALIHCHVANCLLFVSGRGLRQVGPWESNFIQNTQNNDQVDQPTKLRKLRIILPFRCPFGFPLNCQSGSAERRGAFLALAPGRAAFSGGSQSLSSVGIPRDPFPVVARGAEQFLRGQLRRRLRRLGLRGLQGHLGQRRGQRLATWLRNSFVEGKVRRAALEQREAKAAFLKEPT